MEKERKVQIMKAAAKRFARHGLNKTTLDEVARDLRIGKATIYHYFTSKEDLFYQTLVWDISLYLAGLKEIFISTELSNKEKFIQYFSYKENMPVKFKFIYDNILVILREEMFDKESEVLKKLLEEEEKLIESALAPLYSELKRKPDNSLPSFILMVSWGFLFGHKLGTISNPELSNMYKIQLEKSLSFILG